MTTKIQFGSTAPVTVKEVKTAAKKFAAGRGKVKASGVATNAHTEYTTEVKFDNIVPVVNVARTKIDDANIVGVLKGAILDGVPLTVPSNTAGATMHAMKKRCDYAPSLNHLGDFLLGHGLLMDKFEKQEEIRVDQELVTKYLDKCKPGKAERLAEALAGSELRADMGVKHVFAKQEVLLKEHGAQPRVVYQGSDMYNALTGPVIMEINDRMKRIFSRANPKNIGNTVIYACGASGEELGEAMDNATGTPIESDAKNNDGSQSKEFRRPEAMFYAKMGAPMWFVREFARCKSVRVWTRYGVAATVDGQRWSGETTTTTGNSYVHMALMQAALHKANITRSTNIHGGDDYLGFVDGDVREYKMSVESTYKTSGMVAEVVPQASRHHATFYRKRYVRTAVGILPVPQFGRVLAKLNVRANRNTNVNDRDYMAGKYLSAAYEHRHVPALPELLVATSERLSEKPHLDASHSKLAEYGGVDNIKKTVAGAKVHGLVEFGEFLNEVYGINSADLFDTYAKVAESCVEYCSAWTRVDKKGKVVNRSGNTKYKAPVLCGDVIDSLRRLDVE